MFENKHKSLIKKYPKDPVGCAYWQRPEQKYLSVNSIKLTEKIINKFQGKHDIWYILDAISSSIPRSNQRLYLETFYRVIMRFSIGAPKEIRSLIYKMEEEVRNQLKIIDKNEKISFTIKKQIYDSKQRIKNRHLKVIK